VDASSPSELIYQIGHGYRRNASFEHCRSCTQSAVVYDAGDLTEHPIMGHVVAQVDVIGHNMASGNVRSHDDGSLPRGGHRVNEHFEESIVVYFAPSRRPEADEEGFLSSLKETPQTFGG